MAVNLIHKYGIRLSFFDFVKKALPFAVIQIAIALVYVVVILRLFA